MMVSEKRTTDWNGVEEWFELNKYSDPKVGDHRYYAEGYQDPDRIEIREDEIAGEYHIIIDGEDVL